MDFTLEIIFRCFLAVVAGAFIGAERARHGRAAGMRTHILVCLGSALTAMTGIFVNDVLGASGDPFRISAQVISGVGFLGAGMILVKNSNTITGLTTAAGVWTTAAIGIAVGYGFYLGAITVSLLFVLAIVFFARFEKSRKQHQFIYAEIADMCRLNETIDQIENAFSKDIVYKVVPSRSNTPNHLGLEIDFKDSKEDNIKLLMGFDNVIFAIKDNDEI